MAKEQEIKIPDIGGATQVEVIEILVKEGQEISVDTPLITLESDKASMEIPSPQAGKITKIKLKLGDKVSEGSIILLLEVSEAQGATKEQIVTPDDKKESVVEPIKEMPKQHQAEKTSIQEIHIPDIGNATGVDVIDILVKPGMQIEKEQTLITLEGDKATMDIPAPQAGIVKELKIKLGDKVSQGDPILIMEVVEATVSSIEPKDEPINLPEKTTTIDVDQSTTKPKPTEVFASAAEIPELLAAGPGVRRMARELGVDLTKVQGSGRKDRITKEDLQAFVKKQLSNKTGSNGLVLPTNPSVDFSKFGEIEAKPLNKIKKVTSLNLHRAWLTVPQVTQFDEADITELEAFRKSEIAQNPEHKLTLLAFVCAVVSKALKVYPQFNASLDATGEQLIYKKYYNVGIAVETPNGLVVPVIKKIDQLNVREIALEMARLSTKAREKGLTPEEMSGGCFTISSLGGIGGTAFTPIVNNPEVAILGLSRSSIKPVFTQEEFKPRLMLPLSLSYDHRVIDGAEAARFVRFISDCLSDMTRVLL